MIISIIQENKEYFWDYFEETRNVSEKRNFDHKVWEQFVDREQGRKSESLKVLREHAIPWEAFKRGAPLSNGCLGLNLTTELLVQAFFPVCPFEEGRH